MKEPYLPFDRYFVWTEVTPRSLHFKVVGRTRPPDAAEESRFPEWPQNEMHAYATECDTRNEAYESIKRRVTDLRLDAEQQPAHIVVDCETQWVSDHIKSWLISEGWG